MKVKIVINDCLKHYVRNGEEIKSAFVNSEPGLQPRIRWAGLKPRFRVDQVISSLFLTILVVALTLSFPVLYGSAFAATPDPTEQFEPFLGKFIAQLKSEEFKQDTIAGQNKRLVEVASEHFDFREMSKRVMGKQWRTLTDEQRDEFVTLFTKLLQYAYIGSVDEYIERDFEFKKQRIKGKRAEVKTLIFDKSKSIPVSYIMILKGDKWMAYDIVVEGVSLVRNYMEQIRSVLREEKFPGLIAQLEKKIEELETENQSESEPEAKEES